jgi:hypothetical protein
MRFFIDTRHRTPESSNSSDFTIELNESIEIPRGSRVRLHDVSLPYAWRTVESGVNDKLDLGQQPAGGAPQWNILTIPAAQYDGRSLAATIQILMNAAAAPAWGANPFTATYND